MSGRYDTPLEEIGPPLTRGQAAKLLARLEALEARRPAPRPSTRYRAPSPGSLTVSGRLSVHVFTVLLRALGRRRPSLPQADRLRACTAKRRLLMRLLIAGVESKQPVPTTPRPAPQKRRKARS